MWKRNETLVKALLLLTTAALFLITLTTINLKTTLLHQINTTYAQEKTECQNLNLGDTYLVDHKHTVDETLKNRHQ